MYRKSSFFVSSFLQIIPVLLVNQSILTVLYYFCSDTNKDSVENFVWFYVLLVFGAAFLGLSFGLLASTIANTVKEVGLVMPIVFLPFMIVSGFFSQIKSLEPVLWAFSFASPVKYNLQGLILNEFTNYKKYIEFCPLPAQFKEVCNPLSFYDYYEKEIWLNFVIGESIIVLLFLLTMILFAVKYSDNKI